MHRAAFFSFLYLNLLSRALASLMTSTASPPPMNLIEACSKAASDTWERVARRFPFRQGQRVLSLDEVIGVGERYLAVLDDDAAWEHIAEEKGVTVHRLRQGKVAFAETDDKRWQCLKSTAVLPCDTTWVANLLLDSSAAVRYNRLSAGRKDVEEVDKQTKIVWNKSKLSAAVAKVIKPFDSCSMMHAYERPRSPQRGLPHGNDVVLLTRHVEHPAAPVSTTFGRCESIIGLQVLRPAPPSGPSTGKKNKGSTMIVNVNHMRYPHPPYFVNKQIKRATLNYLQGLLAYCSGAEAQSQQKY